MKSWAKKLKSGFASFPPLHKKRFYQGVAVYAMLAVTVGAFVYLKADDTKRDWNARIPQAEVPLRSVFETPQITEAPEIALDLAPVTEPFNPATQSIPSDGEGHIAIIIEGAGLSSAETQRAIEDLPPAIALAFSPYATELPQWIASAKAKQHEVLVLLPMEPVTYPKDDPGPKSLLTRQSAEENARNLENVLSAAKGAEGVINFMGSRFLNDENSLSPIFSAIKGRGGFFVETPVTLKTDAETVANQNGLSYIQADVRIDEKATDAAIRQQLVELEKIARQRGYAVGVAQSLPLTFNVLKSWMESTESHGIKIVSLADIRKAKKSQTAAKPLEPILDETVVEETPVPIPPPVPAADTHHDQQH